jgi:hypothetical protein
VTERDDETFDRFARRLGQIEAEVKDPPQLDAGSRFDAGERSRLTRRSSLRSVAVIAGVAAIVVAAAFIGARPTTGPSASVQAAVDDPSSPPPSIGSAAASEMALVPLDPASPPEEPPGPCQTVMVLTDRMRTTIEEDAARSSAVVIGTVTGVGRAQWNTPNGARPNGANIGPSLVMRLVRVHVEIFARGRAPLPITVWVQGGQIGCHGYWTEVGDIAVGSRSAFFLVPTAPRPNVPDVQEAWQVWSISGDQVSTEFEGKVPLSTFIERASVH